MAKSKTRAPSPAERERQRLAFRLTRPTTPRLDPERATERLRGAWEHERPHYEAGLATASAEARAAFERAAAFFDAGMPSGRRDPAEQSCFLAVVAGANRPDAPSWHDLVDRWLEAGGLAYAIEVLLQLPTRRQQGAGPHRVLQLDPTTTDAFLFWTLMLLVPHVPAQDSPAYAQLREVVAPLARKATVDAMAALAILLDDEPLAKEAVARAEAAELNYRDPWPIELFAILRSGPEFARVLSHGGAALQFFGAGYVLGAVGRLPDAELADALVRFFVAGFAEPRRYLDTYAKKFAAAACEVADPRLAWLFREHGKHKWLAKHAALYLERYPDLRPEAPSDDALAARLRPEQARPRPAGFTKPELDALEPEAREERILSLLTGGHLGTAFALRLLAEYPTPRAAVALLEKITHPNFSSQMPKPGFHKELLEDLTALGKKHPTLGEALAAAKKKKKKKSKKG